MKKKFNFLVIFGSLFAIGVGVIPNQKDVLAVEATDSNKYADVDPERATAIKNSGELFNLNYRLLDSVCENDCEKFLNEAENGEKHFIKIYDNTSKNVPWGTRDSNYSDTFKIGIIDGVMNSGVMDSRIEEVIHGINVHYFVYINNYYFDYVYRFVQNCVKKIEETPESPYQVEDLLQIEESLIFNESLERISNNGDEARQIKAVFESGAFFNMHYKIIESCLTKKPNETIRYISSQYVTFMSVMLGAINYQKVGEKDLANNNETVLKIYDGVWSHSFSTLLPRIGLFLAFLSAPPSISRHVYYENIYFETYMPEFLAAVEKEVKALKDEGEYSDEYEDFKSEEIDLSEYVVAEQTNNKNVPYYWIIISAVGGMALALLVIVLILFIKKRKAKENK